MVRNSRTTRGNGLDLARVLVVDDNPTARLTLQTLLEAGGYRVDAAATAAEAVGKLECEEYELVLSDLQMESPEAGLKVIAHARMMDYKPATAIVTTYLNSESKHRSGESRISILVEPEDIPGLLGKVANLIARRVTRRVQRQLKNSRN